MRRWGEGPASLGIGKGAPLPVPQGESVGPQSGPDLISIEELWGAGPHW